MDARAPSKSRREGAARRQAPYSIPRSTPTGWTTTLARRRSRRCRIVRHLLVNPDPQIEMVAGDASEVGVTDRYSDAGQRETFQLRVRPGVDKVLHAGSGACNYFLSGRVRHLQSNEKLSNCSRCFVIQPSGLAAALHVVLVYRQRIGAAARDRAVSRPERLRDRRLVSPRRAGSSRTRAVDRGRDVRP